MMTLIDYANSSKSEITKGIIMAMLEDGTAGQGGAILSRMPIFDTKSLRPTFYRQIDEGTGVSSRPINGVFDEGTVAINPETINIGNRGGRFMVDNIFNKVNDYVPNASPKVIQAKAKAAAVNRSVNNLVHNGDLGLDPNTWNGIRKYVDSGQVLQASDFGSYTNGLDVDASAANQKKYLTAWDRLIEYAGGGNGNTSGKYIILANSQARWALEEAARDSNFYKTTEDQYGRVITSYKGVEIINPGAKTPVETTGAALTNANMVIPNSYTYGTALTATEIFCIRLGEDGCGLYQVEPLDTYTIDRLQQGDIMVGEVSWYLTFYSAKKSAISVLRGMLVA